MELQHANTIKSMPGFLDVYGYYDTELETWAIDVRALVPP
jgi:hypothetical protein